MGPRDIGFVVAGVQALLWSPAFAPTNGARKITTVLSVPALGAELAHYGDHMQIDQYVTFVTI